MAPFPAPDREFHKATFWVRDERLRDKAAKALATNPPSGKKWPVTPNKFANHPTGHKGILWIPAGKDLEVGRLFGTHAPAPGNEYPASLIEHQLNKLTEEQKRSMGGKIPTTWTPRKDKVKAGVDLTIHQASNSACPMICLSSWLYFEDDTCRKGIKKTYFEVGLRKPALIKVDPVYYGSGKPLPLDVVLIENLSERLNCDAPIVTLDFEVAAGQATGLILRDDLDYKDFDDDVKAFRNRLINGGKFSVILTCSQSIQQELADWETSPGPSLDRFLVTTDPNARLDHHSIKKRDDMVINQAFSAVASYPTLREGLIMELVSLDRQHAHHKMTLTNRRGLKARIASVPESPEKRELLLFVQQPDERALAYNIGDKLYVNIRALNKKARPGCEWLGKVIAYARRPQARDLVILAYQQKKSEIWQGADPSVLKTVNLTTQATPQAIATAVDVAKVYEVDLRSDIDEHVYYERTKTLTCLHDIVLGKKQDPRAKWIEHLFTASRYDKLPRFDIIKDLRLSKNTVKEFHDELDDEQKVVIDHMKAAPGTMVLIEGPAGAGKTHVTIRFAVAIVKDRKAKCSPKKPRAGAHVLFVTPTNYSVENLMEQCDRACQEKTDDAIIVRALTAGTSHNIVHRIGEEDMQAGCVPHGDHEAAFKSAHEMGAASRVFFQGLLTRIYEDFDPDARVTLRCLDLSPADWVLWACRDVLDPNDASVPKVRMAALLRLRATIPEHIRLGFARALTIFEAGVRNKDRSIEKYRKALFHASKAVWPHLYRAADIVIATPVLAMSSDISSFLPAEVVIIDEAACLTSVDGLAFVKYPKCKCVIMSGDRLQPRARLRAGPEVDEFRAQGELSFMIRLLHAGFSSVHLHTQHRYIEELATLLNKVFYEYKSLHTHASVPGPTTLVKVFPHVKADAALALLHVPKTKQRRIPGTESIVNLKTAAATWDIVKKALKGGVPERDISIVVPYKAQAMVHVAVASQFAFSEGKIRCEINILTNEAARGQQNQLVIMDIPNVDSPGFLSRGSRILSAASRARNGLIVVADIEAIAHWNKGHKTMIGKFINEMRSTEIITHVIDDEAQHWTQVALPVFTTR